MERLSIRLCKHRSVQPYSCKEIVPKAEGCVVAEFSTCFEYLAIGCNTGQVLIYSFLTQSVLLKFAPPKLWGKVLALKWLLHGLYVLTDANFLFKISRSWEQVPGPQLDFKVCGFTAQDELFLIYGRSGIVVYNSQLNTIVSVKQSESAPEWFGCFHEGRIITFGSSINTFYILSYTGSLLHSQEVSVLFQSAVRSFMNYSNFFLVNSRDRLLRLFKLSAGAFELVKEVGDYVERKRWSSCCFFKAPDIENVFVLATLQETGSHTLKMFDSVYSDQRVNFARNMHSPLGAATFLTCSNRTYMHPVICVITQAGGALLWASGTAKKAGKWSTSLGIPNFEELQDGNVLYEEAETQYDKQTNQSLSLTLRPSAQPTAFKLHFTEF